MLLRDTESFSPPLDLSPVKGTNRSFPPGLFTDEFLIISNAASNLQAKYIQVGGCRETLDGLKMPSVALRSE